MNDLIPSIGEIVRTLIIGAISYGITVLWKRYQSQIFSFRPPGWLSAALVVYTIITSGLFLWGYYQKYKPLEVHQKEIFDHQTLTVDGKSFQECIFRDCALVIEGTKSFKVSNNAFINSGFVLKGRAELGQALLMEMKEDKEMEPLVNKYIESLKRAKLDPSAPEIIMENL